MMADVLAFSSTGYYKIFSVESSPLRPFRALRLPAPVDNVRATCPSLTL
jgi:hypothetical protein